MTTAEDGEKVGDAPLEVRDGRAVAGERSRELSPDL